MSLAAADGLDAGARQRIQMLETQVHELVRELAAASQRTSELERQLAGLREKVDGSGERFAALYADFAARFRGSAEQITAKLRGYLPDVRQLLGDADPGRDGIRVLDIGCGRGEWLTLLKSVGVSAAGVDSHPAFVEAGRARGLDMVLGDGIEHLATRPANSLDLVTAFHVIEHLDVETLLALIEAAHDALRIGGCLLLETPNPHNLQMAACDFYNDPTHRRPLPPALVEFLVSASGFERVEIRPLHPASSPLQGLNGGRAGYRACRASALRPAGLCRPGLQDRFDGLEMTQPTAVVASRRVLYLDAYTDPVERTSAPGSSPSSDAIGYAITSSEAIRTGLRAAGWEVLQPDISGLQDQKGPVRRLRWLLRTYECALDLLGTSPPDAIFVFHAFSVFPTEIRRMILDLRLDVPMIGYTHGSHWDPTDTFRFEVYPGMETADLANLCVLDKVLLVSDQMQDTLRASIGAFNEPLATSLETRYEVVGLPLDVTRIDEITH